MAMKVFDLTCERSHVFEGWFAGHDAFASQARRGLIGCPICGSTEIRKMLSAPRLNLGASPPRVGPGSAGAQGPASSGAAADRPRDGQGRRRDEGDGPADRVGSPDPASGGPPIDPARLQQVFLAMARRLIESTEDVGDRFADEARRIHYEEAPNRAIRGSATDEEAAELNDEGIEVFALPLPENLKGPLQ